MRRQSLTVVIEPGLFQASARRGSVRRASARTHRDRHILVFVVDYRVVWGGYVWNLKASQGWRDGIVLVIDGWPPLISFFPYLFTLFFC